MRVEIAKRDVNDAGIRDIIRRSPAKHIPDGERTLRAYLAASIEVRYGILDNQIACVWGLRPPTWLSDQAYLWLLTTDIIAEHKFLFVRYSQLWIEEALKHYPKIVGDVMPDNLPARRWLKWLGAEEGMQISGRIPFVIKAKHG